MRSVLSAAALALLAGCGPSAGTDVGNGRTTLKLEGYAPGASAGQGLTLADGTRIESIHMVVERIRFVAGADCDEQEDGQEHLRGPLVANLVAEGVLGGSPEFAVPATTFCKFRLDYHKLSSEELPAGAPSELVDHSIRLVGMQANGDRFTVVSDLDESFELEAEDGGFALDATQHDMLLRYEVGSWVGSLDLASIGAGDAIIDEDQNQDRLNDFEDAVKRTGELLKDGVTLAN